MTFEEKWSRWEAELLAMLDRSDFLCKNVPHCAMCGTEQVEIINAFTPPAVWKCRKCGTRWASEPGVDHATGPLQ